MDGFIRRAIIMLRISNRKADAGETEKSEQFAEAACRQVAKADQSIIDGLVKGRLVVNCRSVKLLDINGMLHLDIGGKLLVGLDTPGPMADMRLCQQLAGNASQKANERARSQSTFQTRSLELVEQG